MVAKCLSTTSEPQTGRAELTLSSRLPPTPSNSPNGWRDFRSSSPLWLYRPSRTLPPVPLLNTSSLLGEAGAVTAGRWGISDSGAGALVAPELSRYHSRSHQTSVSTQSLSVPPPTLRHGGHNFGLDSEPPRKVAPRTLGDPRCCAQHTSRLQETPGSQH